MSIVGGFDVHRRQITFDWVDRATRGWLEQGTLPQASRLQVATALRQIAQLDLELDPLSAGCEPSPAASPAAGR